MKTGERADIGHAFAYNLGNFMRTLAMPETVEPWSLTSLREKLIKIGAKVVSHGRGNFVRLRISYRAGHPGSVGGGRSESLI